MYQKRVIATGCVLLAFMTFYGFNINQVEVNEIKPERLVKLNKAVKEEVVEKDNTDFTPATFNSNKTVTVSQKTELDRESEEPVIQRMIKSERVRNPVEVFMDEHASVCIQNFVDVFEDAMLEELSETKAVWTCDSSRLVFEIGAEDLGDFKECECEMNVTKIIVHYSYDTSVNEGRAIWSVENIDCTVVETDCVDEHSFYKHLTYLVEGTGI